MTRKEAIWWVNHLFEIRKEEYFNKGMMKDAKEVEEAQTMVLEALSVEAVQGEWGHMIADGEGGSHWYEYECSHCGEVVLRPYNYCPNCGAKMTEGGDTE